MNLLESPFLLYFSIFDSCIFIVFFYVFQMAWTIFLDLRYQMLIRIEKIFQGTMLNLGMIIPKYDSLFAPSHNNVALMFCKLFICETLRIST